MSVPVEGTVFYWAYKFITYIMAIDFLNLVIEAFLMEMPSRLNFLRSTLSGGGAEAVRGHVQSMKAGGAFIGISRFTGLCRELKARALTADIAEAAGLLSKIAEEYARVEQDLRRQLDR